MINKKHTFFKTVNEYLGITIGAIFFAISYSWFLIPYKIAPGGVGGLGQIFYHLFGIPVGVFMIIVNIPLFIIGVVYLGKSFGIKSFYGMIITSVFTDILSFESLFKLGIIKDLGKFTHINNGVEIYALFANEDIYLTAIAGSVLLGIGLGIIFKSRGSTGGTDIPVALIKQKAGLSIGTGYWLVESMIILLVGIVFKDLKLVIWGYINLFLTTKITDLTSEGLPYVKGVFIITTYFKEIKIEIIDKLNRGVTIFHTEGGFSEKQNKTLFCVLTRRQVGTLTDIVKDIDPDAFMILTDVSDVMGFGFKSRHLNLSDKKKKILK
jgi:uncharacterized membrane-anchored protein YitT (DUF2179 family)